LDWCMREFCEGFRILIVEFTAANIAAIPTATNGKFRLRKCTVVGEMDLVKIGLVDAAKIDDEMTAAKRERDVMEGLGGEGK